MSADHKHLTILSAEQSGKGLIIHFSDGTITFFQTHFLYEVRDHDGNIALTDMNEDDLMNGVND
jgi:hypothetical protein